MYQTVAKLSEKAEKAEVPLQKSLKAELEQRPKWLSDSCVTVTAWVLLTMGLCIIVSTFYLALRQANDNRQESGEYKNQFTTDFPLPTMITRTNTEEGSNSDESSGTGNVMLEFEKTVKYSHRALQYEMNFRGCKEHYCKVGCLRAQSIYKALHGVMQSSDCHTIDLLMIEEQDFPRGVLRNNWDLTEQTPSRHLWVRELYIRWSNITRIRTDAFNSPIFVKTFFMSWSNLRLRRVDSGALLGLHSLKFLVIDTHLPGLDRSFFQPVQTTLKFLKVNAELTIEKHRNFLGIAYLEKLEYLDLSNNNANGPLTKRMFHSTPNLRYFVMTNSKVTSIEWGTFDSLVGKLQMINLSMNFITVLSGDVIEPLLAASPNTFINLSINSWHCYCVLASFVRTYNNYRSQFLDALYCKAPHRLYGDSIADVDFENCGTISPSKSPTETNGTTEGFTIEETFIGDGNATTERINDIIFDGGISNDDTSLLPGGIVSTGEPKVFQMRCQSAGDVNGSMGSLDKSAESAEDTDSSLSSSESSESSEEPTRSLFGSLRKLAKHKLQNLDNHAISEANKNDPTPMTSNVRSTNLEYFEFQAPEYDFSVDLFKNDSAKVIIRDIPSLTAINVIWFSENNFNTSNVDSNHIENNCMDYYDPYLITDTLEQNTTYTFCIMSYYETTITPFNCLPLHVPEPRAEADDLWISTDDKQFTVGMLCMIYALSTFFGGAVAYIAIKAYPDLLEGSKNVLVVKKSDQNDYVSTISEVDYMKSSSFKKKPLHSSMKSVSSKLPLTESPTTPTMPPFCISSKSLERLSSMRSTSTFFEDSFLPSSFPEDEYEMPNALEVEQLCEDCSNTNVYTCAPHTQPPPLPKRNSSNVEGLNLVNNRFVLN